MTTEKKNLGKIYEELGEHLRAKDERGAREYLAQELESMPEEVRNEIMFELFVDGLQEEVFAREAMANLKEVVVTTTEALLDAKQEAEGLPVESPQ